MNKLTLKFNDKLVGILNYTHLELQKEKEISLGETFYNYKVYVFFNDDLIFFSASNKSIKLEGETLKIY